MLLVDNIEVNKKLSEDQFLNAFGKAKFISDYQDKNIYSLKSCTVTTRQKDYNLDLTFVFKNALLYVIEFWLLDLTNPLDRELVKSEYLNLKNNLLTLQNDITTNLRLHQDGKSINEIHLATTLT